MISRFVLTVYVAFSFIAPITAYAWTEEALKVADPFSFVPNNVSQNCFRLGESTAPTVPYQWHRGSFEWVRVDRKFEIPRAKVRLSTTATAKVTYQNQLFLPNAEGKVDVPVVLTQEPGNEILVEDPVTQQNTKLPIVFSGKGINPAIVLDPSCSASGLKVNAQKLQKSWIYVFCRTLHPSNSGGTSAKIDLDVYWEMEGSPGTVQINNRTVTLDDGLTTSVNADSLTSNYTFSRGKDDPETFELEVHVPERFRSLSVALGLGPYSHQNETRAFTTIYASYYFNETMKLAAFGAFPIRKEPEIDLGLYFIAEQVRALDERFIFNLLLGFHTLSFIPGGNVPGAIAGGPSERQFSFSAPQGIELIFRDFLAKRQNLSYGLFYYPTINNRSYFNSWIRYGGSTFLELNFIQWQEPIGNDTFGVKSFGLSLGFPLFRAF